MTGDEKLAFLARTVQELIYRLVDSQAQGRREIDDTWPAYYTELEIEVLQEKFAELRKKT